MTSASLSFDVAAHEYRLPDGRLVPSVTEILRATGMSEDFDALAGSSSRLAAAIDLKREIGVALHADAHAFDDDDLDWATVDPRVEPYLRAWAVFRSNTDLTPLTRERRVFHAGLFYCGTLDGLFRRADGRTILVDVKTWDPESSGARYQLAGYQLAYLEEHAGEAIHERWSVQLCPELSIPYRITPYNDFRDFGVWSATVSTYWAQSARRRASR